VQRRDSAIDQGGRARKRTGTSAGVTSFCELISAERAKKVRDVIHTDHVFVEEDRDEEAVARLLAMRPSLAAPVLDSEDHTRAA